MGAALGAVFDGIIVLAAMAAGAYLILALWCVNHFTPGPAAAPLSAPPPLTVLKPLCGSEGRLYECLRSFCIQDYPGLQIVCGIAAAEDKASAIVRRLMSEFPEVDIRLVVDPAMHGANRKVSNLINMMAHARHDLLVVSDSDARIEGRNFLRRVVAKLGDPGVGAVTCPYRARPEAGLANALGALLIDDWYFPQALIAQRLGPVDSCFGPVTAVRRDALERIGGFRALADQIADDHMLGRFIVGAGYRVEISDAIADTIVAEDALSLLCRELRWSRTIRATQPAGHFAGIVTCAFPILLGLVALRPSVVGIVLLAAILVLRLLLRLVVHERLDRRGSAELWLAPLRELLCFVVWLASYGGRAVTWRGHAFAIAQNGTLVARRRRHAVASLASGGRAMRPRRAA
jgi:ceramide glucosyltransferase